MIHYQVRFTTCSACDKKIRRGNRRFGPAQVQCGHCKATLRTDLDQWADLPTGRKIILGIGEIIAPSWMNIPGCEGLVIIPLIHMTFWLMLALPLMMIVLEVDPGGTGITTWLLPLAFLLYPALLVHRLYRMIRESNANSRTGAIPIWK